MGIAQSGLSPLLPWETSRLIANAMGGMRLRTFAEKHDLFLANTFASVHSGQNHTLSKCGSNKRADYVGLLHS